MSHPSYWNVIDQIYHPQWTIRKLAHLTQVRRVIAQFWPNGHPTKLIQVAGTSGKGTVCRFLEACLSTVGVVGTVTSPHLFDYRERISINGQSVSQNDIIDTWENRVLPFCIESTLSGQEQVVSFSLIYILMALLLFEKYHVTWGVMETGLGGRYDDSTALDVEVAVLTNVGHDHAHILGEYLWQRVLDKSGICRKGKPFFTADPRIENRNIMQEICNASHAPFFSMGEQELETFRGYVGEMPNRQRFNAPHNLTNGALSLSVASYLLKRENKTINIAEALQKMAQIPFAGRFEQIEPQIYIDIAHNADKISALVNHIQAQEEFRTKRKIFILGLSGQRDPKEVLAPILAVAHSIIVTSTPNEGVDPNEIVRVLSALADARIPIQTVLQPKEALAQGRRELNDDSIMIVTGSTFLIDQMFNPDEHLRTLNRLRDWRSGK